MARGVDVDLGGAWRAGGVDVLCLVSESFFREFLMASKDSLSCCFFASKDSLSCCFFYNEPNPEFKFRYICLHYLQDVLRVASLFVLPSRALQQLL